MKDKNQTADFRVMIQQARSVSDHLQHPIHEEVSGFDVAMSPMIKSRPEEIVAPSVTSDSNGDGMAPASVIIWFGVANEHPEISEEFFEGE